jgi:polyisoprenoid-binding protein YceI
MMIMQKTILGLVLMSLSASAFGQQQADLNFVPSQSTVTFTLGDVLHTVHGRFQVKQGQIVFSPSRDAISGEIVVDAGSGDSGNGSRDRKMNKQVLESAKYPEITFRPDHVEGKVAESGSSDVQVHGMFGIHGSEHEITVPAHVEFSTDHWAMSAHFVVPYVKWGLKDPSTFVLRVEKIVSIDLQASGDKPWVDQR